MKKIISLLLTVLLLFGMIANVISVSAETMAEFDDDSGQTAVDYGFFQALLATNGDVFIPGQPACYAWEIESSINADYPFAGMDQNIVSLFGLQYAIEVEDVNASYNPQIGKGLPANYEYGNVPEQGYLYLTTLENLKVLDVQYNMLDDEDLNYIKSLESLTTLYLDGNTFTTFPDLSGLTNLTFLSLQNCELTEIPVDKLPTSLQYLLLSSSKADTNGYKCMELDYFAEYYESLTGNHIKDISGLVNFPNLQRVFLDGNEIDVTEPNNAAVIAQLGSKLNMGTQNVQPKPVEKHTVTFYVNNEVYATKEVEDGAALTDIPTVPSVEGKTGKWSVSDFTNITADVRVDAVYEDIVYKVTFYVDGEQYAVKQVAHGGTLEDIPTVPSVEGKTGKWSVSDFTNITADVRVDAVYEDIIYKVIFYVDGEQYAVKEVAHGGTLEDIPTVPSVEGKTGKWSVTDFTNITADVRVDAVYEDIIYKVTFYVDGEQYAVKQVAHGGTLEDIPTVPSAEGKTAKWSVTDFTNITADVRVDAVYEDIIYKVTFYVNGEQYAVKEVAYGGTLEDIPTVPSVEGKIGKWSVTDFTNITGDVRVDAVYEDIIYKVTFYVDGEQYAVKEVAHGAALTDIPTVPSADGKTGKWSVTDFTNITADVRVDAVYEDIIYKVTFYVDGEQYAVKEVAHGGTLENVPTVPSADGKTAKWSVTDFTNITADVRVDAVYEDIIYKVTFYVDGEQYAVKEVAHGGTLEDIPTVPSKNGYYAAWDVIEFDNITSNLDVNAVYLPMAEVDPASINVKAKDSFTVNIRTKNTVTNVGIKNENGKYLGKNSASYIVDQTDPDYIIWSIAISINTKGTDRQFSIWIKEGKEFVDTYTTFTANVLENTPNPIVEGPILVGDNAIVVSDESVKTNQEFTVTVKTNIEVTNIKLQSEAGKVLGKIRQTYVEADGVRTWTVVVKLGSKGENRIIDVSLCGSDGQFTDVVGSTAPITVTK